MKHLGCSKFWMIISVVAVHILIMSSHECVYTLHIYTRSGVIAS